MNWFLLIEQLLPSVLGIIGEIVKAVHNTPEVHAPLAAHVTNAVAAIKASATPPSA